MPSTLVHVSISWAFTYISYNLAFSTEESYRLVALAGSPDAKSDTLVAIPSAAIDDKIPPNDFTTPTYIGPLRGGGRGRLLNHRVRRRIQERTRTTAIKNRLIMASAQAQRKALELKPSLGT